MIRAADVVVIGAGAAGLSAALGLAATREVLVLSALSRVATVIPGLCMPVAATARQESRGHPHTDDRWSEHVAIDLDEDGLPTLVRDQPVSQMHSSRHWRFHA